MTIKKRIIFITVGFIAGVVVLIYIQYRSEKNIASLIEGNKSFVSDYEIGNELRGLETALQASESKLKNAVATGDTNFVKALGPQIIAIRAGVDKLQKISDDDSTEIYVDRMDSLIQQKLSLNTAIFSTLKQKGKAEAQQILERSPDKAVSDSIQKTLRLFRYSRHRVMAHSVTAVDKTVAKLERAGTITLLLILTAGSVLFWYIINTVHTQSKLLQQVRESEKKAQDSAEVKEKFLANMSHEIRTPMNAILGFTHLLAQKSLDSESGLYVQTIGQSGERLLSIVNDVLDISKIEAGMVRIEAAPFSLRELLHSVRTMFETKATEKGLFIQATVDESLPDHINGDALRLTQILVNLINNAIKFTQKGSISIRVKNEGATDDYVRVGFTVSDTGIGIQKSVLPYIFDRFAQADDSITREYGGTGLGLSIVKNLVALQKGTLTAESEWGKGTSIALVIPYRLAPPPNAQVQKTETGFDDHLLHAVKILVAEDNDINQSLLRHIFQNHNIQATIVNNGTEALEALQKEACDLVLMDIQMPQMDGYSAAKEIRSRLRLAIPIIAMTAHAFPGEREKCLLAGMNEYIAKPVREEQLLHVMVQVLTAYRATDKAGAMGQKEAYRFIRLHYMREVSRGNTAYEKDVTQQFIAALPVEVKRLQQAYWQKEAAQTGQIAHNLKTTISVMGLNEELDPVLDAIELWPLAAETKSRIQKLTQTTEGALKEAKAFLSGLEAVTV